MSPKPSRKHNDPAIQNAGRSGSKAVLKIRKLNDLFALLGTDPEKNIRIIVRQACELLEGACSLFNRLDEKGASLMCRAGYEWPSDYPLQGVPDNPLCDEASIEGRIQTVVIEDISQTSFQESDPLVQRYNLKSCLAQPVQCGGQVIGSLAVLDTRIRHFDETDIHLISTLAKALSLETERRKTDVALGEREAGYQNLYNNMPVMLCSIDREQNLTSVSNLWLETMGYERDEVMGRSILDFLTSESRQDAEQIYFPIFNKTGRMKNRPFQFTAKSGEIKNILLSAMAEKDNHGGCDGALAFLVDVTKANRTEMEKNRLSVRLQQAQKMEAIATLAGGIAHQFNNALAVILGNLELIQIDGLHDEKINLYIEPINQASQKMVQLTGQLLAYARGGKFQTQAVPAHRFVKETLLLVQHSLAPYVNLETDLDTDSGFINVDLTQMQMLLAAILSNASEAMDGQGQVRISLRHKEVTPKECNKHPGLKPGPQIMLRISDNGHGMDEQTRDRIFEPFFTTKFQGRGLGMAAVYGITKKHGGYVYVESELGEGTTVTVYLPVTTPEEIAAEAEVVYTVGRTGTALIIEDEHLVMEVNRAIIEKLGYQVLEAKSGKEAVEIAKSYDGQIDFALLDVILPDMDGSIIYPKLIAVRPDLKVIVCSGFALDGPARQILDSGAESFVQKPFSVAALSAVLNRIFKNKGHADGL